MKILYIHQYFKTPEEGGCTRSYHLAKGLVKQSHEVTMITAHNQLKGEKDVDGIKVLYFRIPYANHFGFIKRVYAYISFVRKTLAKAHKIAANYDLAYVMTTPLTTGIIALKLKSRHQLPFFFEVGDLWPDAPIKMGAINNRLLKNLLYKFENKCYQESEKVIALSPAIRNYIESSDIRSKVHVITNLSDNEFFESNIKMQSFGVHNPFKIGYFGTFGAANDLISLLRVARLAHSQNLPVHFTLMGDGAQFEMIKYSAASLKNMTILPFGNSHKVKEVLEYQDAVYISFKNIEILNTGSPNKLFDGLAAGKLITLNFGGWVRNLVERNECGFYHDPQYPEEYLMKLQEYMDDPAKLRIAQGVSRALAEKYYDKNLQVNKLIKILNNEQRLNVSDSEVYILTA
jgi:glycosyltransferase involved in cell wall biosynthesis